MQDFKDIVHSFMSMFSLMLSEWEMDNYLSNDFDVEGFNRTYLKKHDSGNISADDYAKSFNRSKAAATACFFRDTCETKDLTCHYKDLGGYRPSLQTQAIMLFLCVYMVLMSILFYHLLIAMVIDSHSRQMEVRKLWVHLSRAEIINILETALPSFLTEQYVCPYIHVLRIVPTRDANFEKIWKQISETESSQAVLLQGFENQMQDVEVDIMSRIEARISLRSQFFDFLCRVFLIESKLLLVIQNKSTLKESIGN